MKKLLKYSLSILCLGSLFSCIQDQIQDLPISTIGRDIIYAHMGEADRVQLNSKVQMSWTAGDVVYVAGRAGNTKKFQAYRFDGATGDIGGSFTAIPELNLYEDGSMYDEYYTHKNMIDDVDWWDYYVYKDYMDYAVTPYNGYEVESWDEIFYCYSPNTAKQNYTPNSSDPTTNILVGSSGDGTDFEFKNLLGFLRISLTGDKVVKSVVVTDVAGGAIGGKFGFNIKETDANAFIWKSDYEAEFFKSSSITLDCGEGVQLGSTPIDFYFAVIPIVMTKGLAVKVHFTDGSILVKSTSKEVEIRRSAIRPMSTIDTSDIDYQTIGITYTGTTAIAPEIIGESSASGYIDWGDGNTSILNFVTSYNYTDGLSSHHAIVKVHDVNAVEFNGCSGITELDLTNF